MRLKDGMKDQYYASHNEGFWPEMGAMLKEHGAHNYCIHLLEDPAGSGGGTLIFYVEIESEEKWAVVKDTEICKKWWKWMEGECPGAGLSNSQILSGNPRLTPGSQLPHPRSSAPQSSSCSTPTGRPQRSPEPRCFFCLSAAHATLQLRHHRTR